LVWLPYEILLEGSMLIGGLPMFMTIMAFFKLRVSEPTLYRPFKACNNIFLAALMMAFPACALTINTILNLNPSHTNFFAMAALAGGSIIVALIAHALSLGWNWNKIERAPLLSNDKVDSYT